MSILNNEGHDPNGFGNTPTYAEVRRLDAEITRLRERCEAYKGQVKCGAMEIERLRAALKPFADYARGMEPGLVHYFADPCPIRATPANGRDLGVSPTVGDCRAAAILIEQSATTEEQ